MGFITRQVNVKNVMGPTISALVEGRTIASLEPPNLSPLRFSSLFFLYLVTSSSSFVSLFKETASAMDATAGKEKLVVEVVAAHNLIPKDGEGSSSPFVEIEFENQRLRTQVKYKDLNPIWNEKLVFNVKDVADLPYRTIEVNVFNEKRSSNSRNFLGKVRISGSSIAKEGEKMVQLHTLEKRSLFSHVRGEISLKLYVSVREEVKEVVDLGNGAVVSGSSGPRLLLQRRARSCSSRVRL
ncbi:hypothetical protein GH714_025440 [Hevea brasiliensis]|uniref:C2 domain-containing protein n=1 Tax=Hevea brasiliensis TaxID=3981 RepID=A0A6A6M4J3_HEVBR|nr:hypothetical protein GH714_025440 [Hevea brasiliensis]